MFLFRNSVNPIEYCATDSRAGDKLPRLGKKERWLFHREVQNSMHAAVYGMKDFDAARQEIFDHGYLRYTETRMLRVLESLEALER
jgi:hypothetical protein